MRTERGTRAWLGVMAALLTIALAAGACSRSAAAPDAAASDGVTTVALPVVGFSGVDNKGAGLEPGMRAPDFVLEYPDGRRTTLSDLRGQPVVINFWATWCAPCKAEMPELVEAFEAHGENGLVVLGINEMEPEERVQKFADQFGIGFPVALDSQGNLARMYLAHGLPTTYFIDRDGLVHDQWRGMLTRQALDERLAALLEE